MDNETKAELKQKYLSYYKDLPVQKYAAMYIGRDEDTIIVWKKQDSDFSDAVQGARAEWVRRKASKARVEFALERLEKEIFAERKEIKIEEDTVDKILKGFGLLDASKDKTVKKSPSPK